MEINKEFKVGIVGQGFVGSAVKAGFENVTTVLTYDKFQTQKSNSSLEEIVENCEIIFVCIPTPMVLETGEAHTGFVEEVVTEIDTLAQDLFRANVISHSPTLVIKSTIPPGTAERLDDKLDICTVAFNPEFLTEANAVNDFLFQDRIVLGASSNHNISLLVDLYKYAFPNATIYETSATNAEMIKYVANCFLAVKVSFANEMYNLCQEVGANYNEVINGAKLDKRLGASHWQVPGPDGDRGFGGHCFPGNYEVVTELGSIKLSDAYQMFINGEKINVKSYNHTLQAKEIKEVAEITCNEFEGELYRFTLENGTEIECTPEHLFPIERSGKIVLIQAKNINENDIFCVDSEYIKYNQKTMTYDTQLQ